MRWFIEGLLELLYPPSDTCPLCGSGSTGGNLCSRCGELLAGYRCESICLRCGRFSARGAGSAGAVRAFFTCPECARVNRVFAAARAVGPYEGVLREAVWRLKFQGRRSLAVPLGRLMADVARCDPVFSAASLVVPVPLSPGRLRQRGFNQAELLARQVGKELDLPVECGVAMKIRETPPQTGLTRLERERNLSGAFQVKEVAPLLGRTVMVVDDVFTSGSTADAFSISLRQAGAARTVVLTLAGARCSD